MSPSKTRPLAGLRVLDFSSRLPGPLAGHLLQELGAEVVKIESSTHPDPFKDLKMGSESNGDLGFVSWYKNINKNKESFILEDSEEGHSKLMAHCKKAHMVIMGWPKKVQEKYGVDFESLSQNSSWGSFVELVASKTHTRAMHDLNIMADQGLLNLHIHQWEKKNKQAKRIAPPFLPIAGATFGQAISQTLLACALSSLMDQKWIHEVVALDESIQRSWLPLYAADLQGVQDSFLHSGRYPCYNIYPLKGHRAHLALACIEEKYWNEFLEAFEINLTSEDRFNEEESEAFHLIQDKLSQFSIEQMQEIIKPLNCCISLILAK